MKYIFSIRFRSRWYKHVPSIISLLLRVVFYHFRFKTTPFTKASSRRKWQVGFSWSNFEYRRILFLARVILTLALAWKKARWNRYTELRPIGTVVGWKSKARRYMHKYIYDTYIYIHICVCETGARAARWQIVARPTWQLTLIGRYNGDKSLRYIGTFMSANKMCVH